jgi:hypothetical protein
MKSKGRVFSTAEKVIKLVREHADHVPTAMRILNCSQIHNQVGDGIAWLEVDSDDANRVRLHGSLAGG